jgi:hypothetical protein
MKQEEFRVKVADWVTVEGWVSWLGVVQCVARDGSWADVNWGTHVKRMQVSVLQVQTVVQVGDWEFADVTRQHELGVQLEGDKDA